MPIARAVTLVVLLLLSVPRSGLAAPDCDGGTVGRLRIAAGRVRFDGTVTRRGVTPGTFVGGGPFDLRIIDTANASEVYAVQVPAERFVTAGNVTTYDHGGTLQ